MAAVYEQLEQLDPEERRQAIVASFVESSASQPDRRENGQTKGAAPGRSTRERKEMV